MPRKKMELSWNVLLYDWNKKQVIDYNVFRDGFIEETKKKIKKKEIVDYETMKEHLISYCRYHFWSKAEYEVLVGDWPFKEESFDKIDVFRQLYMNIDRITEYMMREFKLV